MPTKLSFRAPWRKFLFAERSQSTTLYDTLPLGRLWLLRRFYTLLTICALSGIAALSIAQAPPPPPQNPPSGGGMGGGNSTGAAAKAVYDAEHRPITAGGFVTTGPIVFKDISKESNLSTFVHTMGTPQKKYIIDADGSGVGLIDYDNDGWLDIYMVNGLSLIHI